MEMIFTSHNIIILIVIGTIVVFQFNFFTKNKNLICSLKTIFSGAAGAKVKDVEKEVKETALNNAETKLKSAKDAERDIKQKEEQLTADIRNIQQLDPSLYGEVLQKKQDELNGLYSKIKSSANDVKNAEKDVKIAKEKLQEDSTLAIEVSSVLNPVLKTIIKTINNYLISNKGAASDFHIIKDVVERNCDSAEEEITTLTPIPLYLGLVGTMLGILIGVGFLVFSGGLSNLLNTEANGDTDGIVALFSGVALAMISSVFGILLTTRSSYLMKDAKNQLEKDKNDFFSWFQQVLMPSLNQGATSVIYALQDNLAKFNNTFSSNIGDMKESFNMLNSSYTDQLEILKKLDNLDITQIAKANITVLKQLQGCTDAFAGINQYLNDVADLLGNVKSLNTQISGDYNRTQAIEKMGAFFEEEASQFKSRQGVINLAIGEIDETIKESLDALHNNATKHLTAFTVASQEIQDDFKDVNKQQQGILQEAINQQSKMLQDSLKDTTALIKEIQNVSDVKKSMESVVKLSKEQNNKFDKLIDSISKLNIGSGNSAGVAQNVMPKWMKIAIGTTCAFVGAAALLWIFGDGIDLVISKFNEIF